MEFFNLNRDKLKRDLSNNEMIILSSGNEIYFSGDSSYRFRPNKNFYYYLGLNFDEIYYIALKKDDEIIEKIFFNEIDESKAKWIGEKLTKNFAITNLNFKEENIYDLYSLIKEIKKDISIHNIEKVYIDFFESDEKEKSEFERKDLKYKDNFLKESIMKTLGNNEIEFLEVEAFTKLHRPYKEEYEIDNIKKAIDITDKAFKMVLKNIKSCKTENEIEAYLDFSTRKDGVRFNGFEPIVASGKNATTLHYINNDSEIKEGDLVLLDIGYEYNSYTSDVSRTIPSSGMFTEMQEKIYNIVLDANKKVIEKIKIGMTFKELNDIAKHYLSLGLFKEGLIYSDEELEKYYYHSVSHPLGLEAHDLRTHTNKIEEGMVITVEPGLYIKELEIGVRIEDDIYITKHGNIVLTKNIPKEIDDILKIINEK